MENTLDLRIQKMVSTATDKKQKAQAMGAYLKSGKLNKYLQPILAAMTLSPQTVSCFEYVGESLYIQATVRDLEGMRDPALIGLLTVFEYMNPTSTNTGDSASLFTREFKFDFDNLNNADDYSGRINLKVNIAAVVKEDSETCKRVITGYTTPEPQAIYSLDCSESTSNEAVSA